MASLMGLLFFNSCKKEKTIPELSSCSFSEITSTSVLFSANINDDGGAEIMMRGFVWNTVPEPNLENNLGFSEDGTGTGSYTYRLTGLSPETKYYVKAYAANDIGVAYSQGVVFTSSALAWNGTSCPDCATVTDIVGNVYRTVLIGSQCWLVENLKTTKFNDDTDISNVVENNEWNSITSAAYSWYENDISNKEPYGALYNYYAVASEKLCPPGWHVATDNEWKELEGFVDNQYGIGDSEWNGFTMRGYNAGEKLKSRFGWSYEGNGTDNYGFEVFPNGFRNAVTGEFERENEWGTVWTNVNNDVEIEHYRREFNGQESAIARFNSSPRSGYAVRCIKD